MIYFPKQEVVPTFLLFVCYAEPATGQASFISVRTVQWSPACCGCGAYFLLSQHQHFCKDKLVEQEI